MLGHITPSDLERALEDALQQRAGHLIGGDSVLGRLGLVHRLGVA